MGKLTTILCIGFLTTGCSVPGTKQTIELKCENGLVTFKWWEANVFDEKTDIRHLSNLKQSGFYTDENGKYMKCVEEN